MAESDIVQSLINQGDQFVFNKKYPEALEAYNSAIQLAKYPEDVWFKKSLVLKNMELFKEAESALEQVLRLDPQHIPALSFRWDIQKILKEKTLHEKIEQEKTVKDSVEMRSSIISADIPTTSPHPTPIDAVRKTHLKANASWTRDDDDNLIELFRRGKTMQQLSTYFHRSENAIDCRLKKIRMIPEDRPTKRVLMGPSVIDDVALLFRNEKYHEFIEKSQISLDANPKNLNLWILRGNAFLILKKYADAISSYQAARTLDPDNAYVLTCLRSAQAHIKEISHPDKLPTIPVISSDKPATPIPNLSRVFRDDAMDLQAQQGEVIFLDHYFPYYDSHNHYNSQHGKPSSKILNLKNIDNHNEDSAALGSAYVLTDIEKDRIRVFAERITSLLIKDSGTVVCVMPKSSAKREPSGIRRVAECICSAGFPSGLHVIERINEVAPKHMGGNRDFSKELASLGIKDPAFIKEKVVLLLDDVTTTGNSLNAGKTMLISHGAKQVVLFALGKTRR